MNFQPPAQSIQTPMIQGVGDTVSGIKSGLTNTFNQFSQQAQTGVGASASFLQSNTIVAKVAFLIIVLIAFLFLLNLGITLIGYFINPSVNPYIINGMIDGTSAKTIYQDPKQTDSAPIFRSNNESKGLEFTWSTWIYINDLGKVAGKYQHIFSKGDTYMDPATGIAKVNNAPGVYLDPMQNSLRIIMNTASGADETVDIDNIPIRKWVHIAVRMQNMTMDVYINGTITNRHMMQNVPKQNYNDVQVCQNGGFSGKLSNLRYYSHALNVFEINSVVTSGPSLKVVDDTAGTSGGYTYLSNKWYSAKI